jgi:hypothetical protein
MSVEQLIALWRQVRDLVNSADPAEFWDLATTHAHANLMIAIEDLVCVLARKQGQDGIKLLYGE